MTGVVTVSVVQEPAAHPAPSHSAVFVRFPLGSDAFAATLKPSVNTWPGFTPGAIVHVTVGAATATLHVGGGPEAQAAEPETMVVPEGAESATLIGAGVVTLPVFVRVSVYAMGVDEPATMLLGLAVLVTVMASNSTVTLEADEDTIGSRAVCRVRWPC